MQRLRRPRSAIAAAACLGIVMATMVQGQWTDRWSGIDGVEELARGGARLAERFPRSCGEWEAMNDLETDPRGLEQAGAVGHVSRIYRHRGTATTAPLPGDADLVARDAPIGARNDIDRPDHDRDPRPG